MDFDQDLDQRLPNGMTLREFLEKSLSGEMKPAGEYRGDEKWQILKGGTERTGTPPPSDTTPS